MLSGADFGNNSTTISTGATVADTEIADNPFVVNADDNPAYPYDETLDKLYPYKTVTSITIGEDEYKHVGD